MLHLVESTIVSSSCPLNFKFKLEPSRNSMFFFYLKFKAEFNMMKDIETLGHGANVNISDTSTVMVTAPAEHPRGPY